MYTNYEPTPSDYVTEIKVDGEPVSGPIILSGGSATVTADGAAVMVYDGTSWAQTCTVKVGDQIMLVTSTPYGNIYSVSYIGVMDATNKTVLATMNSGMSFIQGGAPWVTDENGENGYNVKVTGAGNDVLVKDVEDIFGSKLTMKEYVVGYNYKTSTQTYYQANWKKVDVEANAKYLVYEADFAFDANEPVYSFGLSTNGGTAIGTKVEYSDVLAAKVHHYTWIYNIAEGTYVDYINGVALVDEPTAVEEKFVSGTATNIRFTASGTTKMDAAKTEKLDENGEVVNDATVNTYVYTNRAYTTGLTADSDAVDYFYMIVTEKDGICGYYRVCQIVDADVDYAIESYADNGAKRYLSIVNTGDTRDMTVVIAEKEPSGKLVKCNFATQEAVEKGQVMGAGFEEVAEGNSITVYVWETLTGLKAISKPIVK